MTKKICIIPLAGKGSRFEELSYYHKSLLPYKNKTILQHIIENVKSNINDVKFYFILNYKMAEVKGEISKHLEREEFEIVVQHELNGPLGAIKSVADEFTLNKPILIHLGDVIFKKIDVKKDFLSYTKVNDFSRWCMIDDDLKLYDKPTMRPNTNKALSGLYFFDDYKFFKKCLNDVFEKEKPSAQGEYQFSQLIRRYVEKNHMTLEELDVLDFGDINDYLERSGHKLARYQNEVFESNDEFIKMGNVEKIVKEYYHGKFLEKSLEFKTPYISLETDPIQIIQNRIVNKSLDYAFVFKSKRLEYFEQIFYELLSMIKMMQAKKVVNDKRIDIKNIISERLGDGLNYLFNYTFSLSDDSCICHGDFHLGNIFEDKDEINMVDFSGRFYATKNYDLAKLIHGIVYNYHLIKYNLYKVEGQKVEFYSAHIKNSIELFIDIVKKEFSSKDIADAKIICMILFKTMQPLHREREHQLIFEKIHEKLFNEIQDENYELEYFEVLE